MAKRITYHGKDINHVSIGQSKAFDAKTILAGLDLFRTHPGGTPASDNPYLITIAPGIYDEQLGAADTDGLSHVHILGESRVGSVLRYSGTGNANPTILFGDAAAPYQNLTIENMRIVRLGDVTSVAVQIGADAGDVMGSNNADTTRRWADVRFVGCLFEGGEAIRIFGITTASADDSPRLELVACRFLGTRNGGSIQGNIALLSQGTVWRADGTPSWPWTLAEVDWERAGLRIGLNEAASFKASCRYLFQGDTMEALGRDNVGGGATRNSLAGMLSQLSGGTTAAPNVLAAGCRLRAVYADTNGSITSPRFAGLFCRSGPFALDQLVAHQCTFEAHQESGGNYTGTFAGVVCNVNGANPRISGHVQVSDAGAASEFCMASEAAGGTIYHRVTSATAKSGGAGSYTADPLVA